MDDGAVVRPPMRVTSTPVFIATFVGILLATVVLLFLDLFLAGLDRRASNAHAASEYDAGVSLLGSGHPREAADRFASAVAIDRRNVDYALGLGEAMLAEGHVADAEITLKELLERAENDGAVNLAMAHAMVRDQRTDEAKAYYHRAIFGRWGADSLAKRGQTRLELVDLLARLGASGELLAELLPLESTSTDNVALRRRLGALFIIAGSPARAAAMFREVLRRDPRDADAYAGMGDAALALGNIQSGRADLVEALRLRPDDRAIAARLAVADTVLALDPAARRLTSHERFIRSSALLTRTIGVLTACSPAGGKEVSDSAFVLTSTVPRRGHEDSLSDAMIALASDAWSAVVSACAAGTMPDEALRLTLNHLAR